MYWQAGDAGAGGGAQPPLEAAATAEAAAELDADSDMAFMPLPRINCGIVVLHNTLFVFGGLLEVKDREITLDDIHSIDLVPPLSPLALVPKSPR